MLTYDETWWSLWWFWIASSPSCLHKRLCIKKLTSFGAGGWTCMHYTLSQQNRACIHVAPRVKMSSATRVRLAPSAFFLWIKLFAPFEKQLDVFSQKKKTPRCHANLPKPAGDPRVQLKRAHQDSQSWFCWIVILRKTFFLAVQGAHPFLFWLMNSWLNSHTTRFFSSSLNNSAFWCKQDEQHTRANVWCIVVLS